MGGLAQSRKGAKIGVLVAFGLLVSGCGCAISVVERGADARPAWLDDAGIGRSEGEPTARDAVEAAGLSAAAEIVSTEIGVTLGATLEAISTFDDGRDRTSVTEAIRSQTSGYARFRVVDRYAERVHDGCTARRYWRAWAKIEFDRAALRAGLHRHLAATGPRVIVQRAGSTATISSPAKAFVYAFVGAATTPAVTATIGPDDPATVRVGPRQTVRVFASPRPAAGAGPALLSTLYRCLSSPQRTRCSLVINDASESQK